ncbi:MAG: ThuA domain-containing protein [Cyclobacteriaceae bacterium]|nr:ThuA domain-containing protein [Cyclobacteriaceae bacterium]
MRLLNINFCASIVVFLIAFFTTFSAISQPLPVAVFSVHSGRFDRENTPVSVSLEQYQGQLDEKGFTLYETTGGKERPAGFQLSTDGVKTIHWILSGKTPAGVERTFELRLGAIPKAGENSGVGVIKDNDQIMVTLAGKEVIGYRITNMPVPKKVDDKYSRSGFFHPLNTPGGETITRIQPPDHYHHYGLWNPWTKVEFQGKVMDYWNLGEEQATVRSRGTRRIVQGPVFGGFQAINDHVDLKPDQGEEVVALNEAIDITVWNTRGDEGPWIIDFTSVMNCATPEPFIIKEYRYQGFGLRATEKWDDKTASLLTSQGLDKASGNGTRARWCDINGVSGVGTSGILFMTHPTNYNFPEPIRIWPEGMNDGKENVFFNFNPAMDRDWKLEPGKSYRLKYRMMLYDGKTDSLKAEQLWNDFAYPPQVEVVVTPPPTGKRILVYTKNGEGYVHDNIANSVKAIKEIGGVHGFAVDASDDPAIFSKGNLDKYAAIVFSNTNNEAFDNEEQKAVFQEYIRSGGGFVGIHSASGSERQWPWYWGLVGGKFIRHAPRQDFTVNVVDRGHPSTYFLPEKWERDDDECYYLQQLNPDNHALLKADMTTVEDKKRVEYPAVVFGDAVPLAWYHEYDGGKSWYTSLGHHIHHYDDPVFRRHLLGGLLWVMQGRH